MFKISKMYVFILILLNMLYSISCIKTKVDIYKIVQSHSGIKQCAVIYNRKSDVVGISVSHRTGECKGLTMVSSTNFTSDTGYALRIHSVINLQPEFVLGTTSDFDWAIPGGLGVGARLDVFVSGFTRLTVDWGQLEMFLSEGPFMFMEFPFYGFSVQFKKNAPCYTSNRHQSERAGAEYDSLLISQRQAKISAILLKQSVKILVDDKEQCSRDRSGLARDFQSFHHLHLRTEYGIAYVRKIQLYRNL